MATGAVLAGVAVGGAAISAYGQYKQSEAQADSASNQAEAQEQQANELIRRSLINAEATERQGKESESQQLSSFVASGVEIGEGTPLTVLEDTMDKVARQVSLDMESAEYDAAQLRAGAGYLKENADDMKTAGQIAAIGSLAGSAAGAYGGQ